MANQKKAYIYGLVTVLLWSTVATAFKLTLAHLDHIQLLLYAMLTSTLVLTLVLKAQGRLGLLFSFTPRQYLVSAGFGFLNPFLYYLILFKAYDLLPAQEAQPLNYTWAVALALLSIPLLGQKMRFTDFAATSICYAGVVVISTRGDLAGLHFANPFGVFLALASTVIWALYWIFNTKDTRDPVAGLLLNFLFGLPWIIVCTFFFSSFSLPSWSGLAGAVYVGTFEMGITFVTWLMALKNSENTSKVGNLIFISPFLSLVFISLFLGEAILPSTFAGLGLIMCGLGVQKIRRQD